MSVTEQLIEYMRGLEIIDCHEHLQPERERLVREVDALWLVSLYAFLDMAAAGWGKREVTACLGDSPIFRTDISLEDRWHEMKPFLDCIKYGSSYRATAIAIRDIYGIDDLNDDTYVELTEKMRAANKPGLYRSILRDRCKIRTCLVQNGRVEDQDPQDLFTPVYDRTLGLTSPDPGLVENLAKARGEPIADLDAYLEALCRELADVRSRGAVAMKIDSKPRVAPDMAAARKAFAEMLGGAPASRALESTILERLMCLAGQWDWPVAVHTGIWGDYRNYDPKSIIDVVKAHPGVRFDLYHLGMPYARDCIFIAKLFPNAHLNLCWSYAISQEITRRTINEILDTVPVNKVFGFGADYCWEVENVYGHLAMARETLAEALSERIARNRLDLDGAKHIARLWLCDNPARFYGLSVEG